MRGLLCICAVLLSASSVQAQTENVAERIAGEWVSTAVPKGAVGKFTRTYTKEGKFTEGGSEAGVLKLTGTYTVEGAQLIAKYNGTPSAPGSIITYTITKFTDAEMTLLTGKKSETFRRVKEAK
jgi:uncharacterized protein (TIGR03066 family)